MSDPTPTAAPTRSRPKLSLQALGYFLIFSMSLMVISPVRRPLLVHHQELFDAVLMEQFFRLFQTDALGDRDQPVLGHHVRHLLVHVGFEAQIPVGDDADRVCPPG